MKKARMNIFHSRFILLKLKIFGEIVTTFSFYRLKIDRLIIDKLIQNHFEPFTIFNFIIFFQNLKLCYTELINR